MQLRWAQQVAGTSTPILEHDQRLPQLSDEKWITTLMEYLQESELGISITGFPTIKAKRENDIVLMDEAIQSGISDKEIQKVNRCRMYLKAESLADICNAAGTHIQQDAANLETRARLRPKAQWPRQERPGPAHIKIWKKFLKSLSDENGKVNTKMGEWTESPSKQNWQAHLNKDSGRIRISNQYWKAAGETRRGTRIIRANDREEYSDDEIVPVDTWETVTGERFISNTCNTPKR